MTKNYQSRSRYGVLDADVLNTAIFDHVIPLEARAVAQQEGVAVAANWSFAGGRATTSGWRGPGRRHRRRRRRKSRRELHEDEDMVHLFLEKRKKKLFNKFIDF